MTALNLGIWKFKYLFHDIEKPFLLKWYMYIRRMNHEEAYKCVQQYHRAHNKHHITYWVKSGFDNNVLKKLDFEGMVIDWECSRFTKAAAPKTAIETLEVIVNKLTNGEYNWAQNDPYISMFVIPSQVEFFKTSIEKVLNKVNLTK